MLNLPKSEKKIFGTIEISGSKSKTNRLLVLQQYYPNLKIKNSSVSDDSKVLSKALKKTLPIINIGHAGTAMRFLTAYYAAKEGIEVELTGSERMKNRPIKILVKALKELGANIIYKEKEGYPPLKIIGKKINKRTVFIQGNVSSQYISALMLIAPKLPNGLVINLEGKITSAPYINMTFKLLKNIGIKTSFVNNKITIYPTEAIEDKTIEIESDWSSASYYYALVALSKVGATLRLKSYKENSLQGDSYLAEIYEKLGVFTKFKKNTIIVTKQKEAKLKKLMLNLKHTPDIAQTLAVTCFGLGKSCVLEGLHTLKIKETDRLKALKAELEKLGGSIIITRNTLYLKTAEKINKNVKISTYQDHRMAMAFAPLALKTSLQIENPRVVSKSYPNFWNHFNQLLY